MGTTTCMSCMGTGFRTMDGLPIGCPDCEEGRKWSRNRSESTRSVQHGLPPGGDVLQAQARRKAANLPVGVLPADGPGPLVRAVLEEDRVALDAALSDAMEARTIARYLAEAGRRILDAETVGAEQELASLREALDALPAWAVVEAPRPSLAAVAAAPLDPPD